MPRRSKNRTSPVRLDADTRARVDHFAGRTAWSVTKSLAFLTAAGAEAIAGAETRLKNRVKYANTIIELRTAQEKADERLAGKRSAARALAALLRITGPDIPDGSQIGNDNVDTPATRR